MADAPTHSPGAFDSPAPKALASALPDFTLALAYLVAWLSPGSTNPGVLRWLLLTMLLEFIVLHSAAFMSRLAIARDGKGLRAVVLLGGFYSIFVGGFSLAFHTAWPLVSFWALMLNRATVMLFRQAPQGDEPRAIEATWSASLLFYMVGCFLTAIPPLPRFGFGPEFVAAMDLHGSGVWEREPWRVMAFGFVYFGAMGLFQLLALPAMMRATGRAAATPSRRAA